MFLKITQKITSILNKGKLLFSIFDPIEDSSWNKQKLSLLINFTLYLGRRLLLSNSNNIIKWMDSEILTLTLVEFNH